MAVECSTRAEAARLTHLGLSREPRGRAGEASVPGDLVLALEDDRLDLHLQRGTASFPTPPRNSKSARRLVQNTRLRLL